MHYGENSIVLGENWRPYGRHFALKAQKKGPRNMRLREKKREIQKCQSRNRRKLCTDISVMLFSVQALGS
jgi:hypothetical protein